MSNKSQGYTINWQTNTITMTKNSTAYIQNWLHALKDNKRLIVSAAGRAEKAVQMILGEDEATV